jgi:hypothetical protein
MKKIYLIIFLLVSSFVYSIDFFVNFEDLNEDILLKIYSINKQSNIKYLKILDYQIIDTSNEEWLFLIKLSSESNALMAKGNISLKKRFNKNLFKEGSYNFFIEDKYFGKLIFDGSNVRYLSEFSFKYFN